MADSQILTVIRMWAAMAWADGVMSEAEADGLRRLIRTADLTAEERSVATTFLATPIPLPETDMRALTPEARRGIYRAACRLAVVDHVFAAAERQALDRMRTHPGIPDETAAEIEADTPGML